MRHAVMTALLCLNGSIVIAGSVVDTAVNGYYLPQLPCSNDDIAE